MGYWENRRQRKLRNMASEEGQKDERLAEVIERKEKKRDYRRKNRISDLKKIIPAFIFTAFSFIISYKVLSSSVGGQIALGISIPSIAIIYFLVWGMISRTYTPPYEKFFVTGHVDPDNTDSAIFFQKWMIPKKILSSYLVEGIQFSVMTTEGLMFFCERLDFDWETGELYVKFGWPGEDEFNFLLRHGVFHEMKEVIPLLLKKLENIEANLEVLVHLKAKDMEQDHFKRVLHALLDITKAKTNTDLERYREEIEKTNREIDLRIRPKKVNVELKSGEGESNE